MFICIAVYLVHSVALHPASRRRSYFLFSVRDRPNWSGSLTPLGCAAPQRTRVGLRRNPTSLLLVSQFFYMRTIGKPIGVRYPKASRVPCPLVRDVFEGEVWDDVEVRPSDLKFVSRVLVLGMFGGSLRRCLRSVRFS
jgi:hypothetical protein